MKNQLKLLVIMSLVMVMGLSVGIQAANFPLTLEDDLENEITLKEKPQRIISLSPSNTEMLFALGLGDKIVGVTKSANYPQAALKKEKIGTITDPNVEKIVSLEPDLVVASAINKMQSINKLRELGIKVAGFNPGTVNETILTIKKLGKITGEVKKAQDVVTDMYMNLVDIKNIVDSHLQNHKRKNVFYELWDNPLMTAGDNTFVDDLIELAGGINIGAQARGKWPQYNLEKLITEDPQVYISTPHSSQEKVTVASIKNRDRFKIITAIKKGNIQIVNQDIVNRPSPRIIKGLKIFVKAIHPELTEKIEELN